MGFQITKTKDEGHLPRLFINKENGLVTYEYFTKKGKPAGKVVPFPNANRFSLIENEIAATLNFLYERKKYQNKFKQVKSKRGENIWYSLWSID